MKRLKDSGMTILEVVIAIAILLIGVGFVLKSNAVSYHYQAQYDQRQQMIFYASGIMEAALDNELENPAISPVNNFVHAVNIPTDNAVDINSTLALKSVEVDVSDPDHPDSQPVKLYTYKIIKK